MSAHAYFSAEEMAQVQKEMEKPFMELATSESKLMRWWVSGLRRTPAKALDAIARRSEGSLRTLTRIARHENTTPETIEYIASKYAHDIAYFRVIEAFAYRPDNSPKTLKALSRMTTRRSTNIKFAVLNAPNLTCEVALELRMDSNSKVREAAREKHLELLCRRQVTVTESACTSDQTG